MDQETWDIIIGAAILVPFLIVVFAVGFALNRFKNRRFHAAWRPLVPIVDGKVVEDGGGAASSWLTGTFQGRHVQAGMTPNQNAGANATLRYNYFDIAFESVQGECDWRVEYRLAVFGIGGDGWRIVADDTALAERLRRAGVLDIVDTMRAGAHAAPPMAPAVLEYRERSGTLTYREDTGTEWAPSPDRFRNQLTQLLHLVDVNAQVNPKRTQRQAESGLKSALEALLH